MAFKSVANRAAPPANRGVIKQSGNKLPKNFAINASAAGVAVLIAILAVRGVMVKEDIAQCSERFGNGTLFGLQQKSGAPISTPDLQARLAGRDWGVLENLKLVAVESGPAPVAMQIALPKLVAKPDDETPARSGMGFTWLMPKLATASAACLTYNVWLPDDFNFGAGGLLPGLFGGEAADAAVVGRAGTFMVRQGWADSGMGRLRAFTAESPRGVGVTIDPERLKLATGRWIKLEQELVLNQPGANDGVLRIWVDGKLRLEDHKITYRKDDRAQFRGVLADVHYGPDGQALAAVPKSTAIKVTPFEVRWQ